MHELGEESIQLRFNYIARVTFEEEIDKKKAIRAIKGLPEVENITEGESHGYRLVVIKPQEYQHKYQNRLIKSLISVQYERRFFAESGLNIWNLLVFWLFPDFIVFSGRKDAIEKAVLSFKENLAQKGLEIELKPPDFEWYYLMKVFESCQEARIWESGRDFLDEEEEEGGPPEIAEGVVAQSIHDVSLEWERDSIQAKIIDAKKAKDCTQDLATGVAILEGRELRSVLLYLTMEDKGRFIRLKRGGSIFVLKKQAVEVPETEQERLLWGLEFARRLYDAYEVWKRLSIDDRLPTKSVYRKIHEQVKESIAPILKKGLDERLSELKVLREDLKRREEQHNNGSVKSGSEG